MRLSLSGRALMATCACVLIASGGAAVALSVPNVGDDTNENGQTFGKAPVTGPGLSGSDVPDLVAVVGDHGVEGYVRAEELAADPNANPATPEEALAIQATAEDRVLPVLAADGRTQLDTLTVWGPNHEVSVPFDAPEAARP